MSTEFNDLYARPVRRPVPWAKKLLPAKSDLAAAGRRILVPCPPPGADQLHSAVARNLALTSRAQPVSKLAVARSATHSPEASPTVTRPRPQIQSARRHDEGPISRSSPNATLNPNLNSNTSNNSNNNNSNNNSNNNNNNNSSAPTNGSPVEVHYQSTSSSFGKCLDGPGKIPMSFGDSALAWHAARESGQPVILRGHCAKGLAEVEGLAKFHALRRREFELQAHKQSRENARHWSEKRNRQLEQQKAGRISTETYGSSDEAPEITVTAPARRNSMLPSPLSVHGDNVPTSLASPMGMAPTESSNGGGSNMAPRASFFMGNQGVDEAVEKDRKSRRIRQMSKVRVRRAKSKLQQNFLQFLGSSGDQQDVQDSLDAFWKTPAALLSPTNQGPRNHGHSRRRYGVDKLPGVLNSLGLGGCCRSDRNLVRSALEAGVEELQSWDVDDMAVKIAIVPRVRASLRDVEGPRAEKVFVAFETAFSRQGSLSEAEAMAAIDWYLSECRLSWHDEDVAQLFEYTRSRMAELCPHEKAPPHSEDVERERIITCTAEAFRDLAQYIHEKAHLLANNRTRTLSEEIEAMAHGDSGDVLAFGNILWRIKQNGGKPEPLEDSLVELGALPVCHEVEAMLPIERVFLDAAQDILLNAMESDEDSEGGLPSLTSLANHLKQIIQTVMAISKFRPLTKALTERRLAEKLDIMQVSTTLKSTLSIGQGMTTMGVSPKTITEREVVLEVLDTSEGTSQAHACAPLGLTASCSVQAMELVLRARRAAERRFARSVGVEQFLQPLRQAFAKQATQPPSVPGNHAGNNDSVFSGASPCRVERVKSEQAFQPGLVEAVAFGDGLTVRPKNVEKVLAAVGAVGQIAEQAICKFLLACMSDAEKADDREHVTTSENAPTASALGAGLQAANNVQNAGPAYLDHLSKPVDFALVLLLASVALQALEESKCAFVDARHPLKREPVLRCVAGALGLGGPLVQALPARDRETLVRRALGEWNQKGQKAVAFDPSAPLLAAPPPPAPIEVPVLMGQARRAALKLAELIATSTSSSSGGKTDKGEANNMKQAPTRRSVMMKLADAESLVTAS